MDLHREQIRRADWAPFMERFSRAHRGWRVRVGVIDTCLMRESMETEARPIAGDDALFEGLRMDGRDAKEQLTILLGLPNALTTHAVLAPRKLYVERTAAGTEEALRIDAGDGTTLLLQFSAAPTPEETDGMTPGEM